jgi:antitoxin VapB
VGDLTGDVVWRTRPGSEVWRDFFETMRSIEVPDDFLSERPMNVPPRERDLFPDER